ncbi:sodium:pantothenate symporter [Aliarcobacter cryaerophilus]|uniref:Sodium:pantothenate symporter n=1 Tax=Aliarcobacter cryaerophilus TaxID=28198 RepID=A0A2S9SRY2_9BACT|nr:sodium:pantothenate symporter [Aliarcobacter cryaerophilus]
MDTTVIKKIMFPFLFLVLAYFVLSYESAKEIIAGIAIFLVGMFFMEDGFKLFSGGFLEKILEKFTNSISKGILNGFLISSIVQSSSLTSVILISFLTASLITLESAIYVLLGSSLGSSTTAWLIALFGLKIKISHYAMPIIAFGIFFRFSKNLKHKGFGNILLGLGFIFLGISYMVNGFDELKQSINLAVYSNESFFNMILFFILGAIMTFVVQSSSASTTLTLVALASGQILYLNAIAIIIGGKIGSTTTTILGSLNSNSNGKRLAFFQFILNLIATVFGIIFLYPIVDLIDFLSLKLGIFSDAIKLTIFITIFNLSAVVFIIPFLNKIVLRLKTMFIPKMRLWSKLEFLDANSLESSKSILKGHKKENEILYYKFIKATKNQFLIVENTISNKKNSDKKLLRNIEIDKVYKNKLKTLHDEIFEFLALANNHIEKYDLKYIDKEKSITKDIYKLLKLVKKLLKNIIYGLKNNNTNLKSEYFYIKDILNISINEIENIIKNSTFDDIDRLYKIKTLQQKILVFDSLSNQRVENLFESKNIDTKEASKLIKDSSLAIILCQNIINLASQIFVDEALNLNSEDDEDEN